MDAVSHQIKTHPMAPGLLSETVSSATVLPPTSIRDITALIFILLALPQSLSCLLLITYILSGSSKFLGGRLIVRHLSRKSQYRDDFYSGGLDQYEFSRKNMNYKSKLIGSALQAFSINALILLTIHYFFPRRWIQYLSILAKSIIASELIGSSTTNSTTITSITSTTTTSTTTTTTINNKKNNNIKGSSELKCLNNHIRNAFISFVAVLYINYLMQNWLLIMDMNQIRYLFSNIAYDMKAFVKQPILILNPNTHTNLFSQLFKTASPFLLTSRIFHGTKHLSKFNSSDDNILHFLHGGYYKDAPINQNCLYRIIMHLLKYYLKLNDSSLSIISRSLATLSVVLNYVYLVLSIHVIILTISPILKKSFLLKRYSKTLDDLSNLTPNVPIDFKRNYLSKSIGISNSTANIPLSSSGEPSSASDILPIVVNVEQPKDEILEIDISSSISKSSPCAKNSGFSKSNLSSTAAENFQTFCITPFTNKLLNPNLIRSQKYLYASDHSSSKAHKHIQNNVQSQAQSQHSIPNSTTIIDKNLVNVTSSQPFWAVLAACKAMFKEPNLFAGEATKRKNNGGKFLMSGNIDFEIAFSIVFIDDSRVVFRVLDIEKLMRTVDNLNTLGVKVNNVNWAHMDIYNGSVEGEDVIFVCVYGLTPLFQYEIELFEIEKEYPLAHFMVNTVSSASKTVLNKSPEITPLMTLQSSLISTIENLNRFKAKFRKLKKEENKKISDAKKDIDNLKNKISKYNNKQGNDSRISGKLKGLQHSVIQLENEIQDLKDEIQHFHSSQQESDSTFKEEEARLQSEIKNLNHFINEYEHSMNEYRAKLKNIEFDKQQLATRKSKLLAKKQSRNDELQKLSNDIKGLKRNGIIGKLHRRNKRVQEKYDIILPKVINATADLQRDFEDFLLESNKVGNNEIPSKIE